jgi:hypothetical protein
MAAEVDADALGASKLNALAGGVNTPDHLQQQQQPQQTTRCNTAQ